MASSQDTAVTAPPKARHRASVACCACRERRTRCVVPANENACIQCRDAGQECIIKHDDQRRKPVSKAYVSMLEDRIGQLESMLRDRDRCKDEQIMTTTSPAPQTTPEGILAQKTPPETPATADNIPCRTQSDPTDFGLLNLPPPDARSPGASSGSGSIRTPDSKKESVVHKLLSTRGHLSFDQRAGRLRYFGPTTNCHIYSELAAQDEESYRAMERDRRTQHILAALGQETHDYLIDLFWQHYNSVIHVIHRGAFEQGRIAGGGPFYSGFLHICVLATGYRFADKQRPDMVRIARKGRESSLHQEAKFMLDFEIERPGGITSIAALLLLGDLEVGCGRDNVGWLYSGMANRLCFDIGLHLDGTNSGLLQQEIEIGRMTLWACVIYDRYWALFLGRPTALKPEDLEVYQLSQQFDRLGMCQPAGPEKSLEKQIYEALLELMELAGKITEIMDKASKHNDGSLDQHVFIRMSALDRELETWYSRLPPSLQFNATNVQTCPFSFFLLHQQFYSAKILLHRQFAQYDDILDPSGSGSNESSASSSHFSALARATCTTCAGRIAQIFWQHRQRFDTRQIFVTGLQHAGNAATALVAAIVAAGHDRAVYHTNMKYLECVTAALGDMAETYQPAERMAAVLNIVLLELQELHPGRQSASVVPARRDSSADRENELSFIPSKKGQWAGHHQYHRTRPGGQQTKPSLSHSAYLSKASPPPPESGGFSMLNPPSQDGFVVVSNDKPRIATDLNDPSWPKFNSAPNQFSLDNTLVATGPETPPTTFSSVWVGAETPTFSPLVSDSTASASLSNESATASASVPTSELLSAHELDMEFMSLLNDTSDGAMMGDDAGVSKAASSTREQRRSLLRRSGPENYESDLRLSDDIWNEILKLNSR